MSKAVVDTIIHKIETSIFNSFLKQWWNPIVSWDNKNKYKPKWLFRTYLVFVTDAFHLFENIRNNSLLISISLLYYLKYYENEPSYYFVIIFVIFKITYSSTFHLCYTYWFKK